MSDNEPTEPKFEVITVSDRDELIRMLSDVSKKLYRRITSERFRERAPDPTFLGFCRAFSQIAQAMNSTLKDSELDDMNRRLEELEQRETSKHKIREYE